MKGLTLVAEAMIISVPTRRMARIRGISQYFLRLSM